MSQSLSQLAAVLRLEWKKTFFTRRGLWVYILALGPVALTLFHTLISLRTVARFGGHRVAADSFLFAAMFQLYFLHLGIFFGCVGVFSNLFRGEMLEKTLHYYLLTPIRRELLVVAKYLSGLLVALILFMGSVGISFYLIGYHQGATWSDFLRHGPGQSQLIWYLVITLLAVLGYGAIFLAAGLFIRNPMIPAAVVWVWENLNPFLPSFLQKISVIFYLKGLSPVRPPEEAPPLLSVLTVDTAPPPAVIAILCLVILGLLVLSWAAVSARRVEINYGE